MLSRIFPARIDNDFHGSKLALWLFIPLVLLSMIMDINSIVIGRTVAQAADGVPLDTYTTNGANTVVTLFALWGISQLMVDLLSVLALIRYRAMIPLLYVLFLAEALSRRAILLLKPIVKTAANTAIPINWILIAMMVLGLLLAVQRKPESRRDTIRGTTLIARLGPPRLAADAAPARNKKPPPAVPGSIPLSAFRSPGRPPQ